MNSILTSLAIPTHSSHFISDILGASIGNIVKVYSGRAEFDRTDSLPKVEGNSDKFVQDDSGSHNTIGYGIESSV